MYLRAFVFIPQVYTLKWIRTDDVGAGFVGRAVLLQVPGHGGLSPLGPVHGRRERQVLPLQSDVVKAACSRSVHEFRNKVSFIKTFTR